MLAPTPTPSLVRLPFAGHRACTCTARAPELRRARSSRVFCKNGDSTPHQESSTFKSNLRKGFTPMSRESIKQMASTSSSQAGANPGGQKLVLGADDFSMERWLEVDKQMNKYPGTRTFTAIGSAGDDFKTAMVEAVESVTGPVDLDRVTARPSSQGAYVSVKIGPVVMTSPDQVVKIFANMKSDPRLKWCM